MMLSLIVICLYLIEAVMNLEKRNNTSAILKVVGKYMGKHLISGHTFAGILEKGHLYVTGCSVGKDLHGVMNCKDIGEPTQVSRKVLKQNVFYFIR